ncbi:MAG: TlpA family protein disulfide reductase [Cyclobacteriaceae bacterium]
MGDTLEQHLSEGIYRFVVNQKLGENLQMYVMDTQGERLSVRRYDKYLEFVNHNRSVAPFYFTFILEDTINTELDDDELLGRLFFVYHKNILKDAPSFELVDVTGNRYTNKSLMNKVVVLNLWHTRCRPCIKEMPYLNTLGDALPQYSSRAIR